MSAPRASLPVWAGIPLVLIFTLSGASGLAYEVLWTRQLTFVLGGSAMAVSTVLAVFMAGLGLGGFIGGRYADRVRSPLLCYALAEFGIGLLGLITPILLSTSGAIYLGLHSLLGGQPVAVTIARTIAAGIILLIPTTLMGATLPFMARFFIRSIDRLGRGLGLLYGVNILGGVLGAGFAGYFGAMEFGVRTSIVIAAGGNILAATGALLVWALAKGRPSEVEVAAPQMTSAAPRDPGLTRLLMLGFGISGFTSLAYQVLWTRALNFAIGNSVYAFTTILVVVLAGLFFGAMIAGILADRSRSPLRLLGWVQWLAVAAILISFSQAGSLPAMTTQLVAKFGAGTLWKDVTTKVVPAAIALLLPCTILGMTFPLVLKVATARLDALGNQIGRCYAVNTIGAILGSLVAGYVLLPIVGLERGIYVVALVNGVLGLAFLRRAEHGARAWGAAAMVGCLVLLILPFVARPQPFIVHTKAMKAGDRKVLFHREGRTASVAVTEKTGDDGKPYSRDLHINLLGASVVDREHYHQQYYAMVSLLPLALHPEPKQIFVAGLASGVTTGAATVHSGTEMVTSVEISPEVIAAAPLFAADNFDVTRNPKAKIIADDARAWLATTDRKFDIIVTDVFISAVTGTAGLYSKEYFELCRTRLKPGGMMSVGVGQLQGTDRNVARTFAEVFPYVVCFAMDDPMVYNQTFFLGANEPIRFDRAVIEAAYAQPLLQTELARYGMPTVDALVHCYFCDREPLLEPLRKSRMSTDDRPVIDFQAVSWAEGFVGELKHEGAGILVLMKRVGRRPFPWTGA